MPVIDPTKKKHWVKVLPDLPGDFRFRDNPYIPTERPNEAKAQRQPTRPIGATGREVLITPEDPNIYRRFFPTDNREEQARRREAQETGSFSDFGTDKLHYLNIYNYDTFIVGLEKALVMFYDPHQEDNIWPAREFARAAKKCNHVGYGFGYVNCSRNEELCCREKATTLPMYKLFSNGRYLSTVRDSQHLMADQMNMLVTMTPVLQREVPITENRK